MFPSKVDPWLLWSMVGGTVLCAALLPISLRRHVLAGVALLVSTVGMALGTWMVATVTYTLEDGWLVVQQGPFPPEAVLRLDAIDHIGPSQDRRGAAAASLDRLAISHHTHGPHGYTLISPSDKGGFLDAVAPHVPHLVRDDLTLAPR